MLRTKKKNLIRSTIKKVSGLVLRFFLNGEIVKFCFPRFFTFCVFIFIVTPPLGDSFKGIGPLENDSKNETLWQGATFAFGPK